MIKKLLGHVVLWGFLLGGSVVWCDTVSDALQHKLNAMRTLKADFHQVVNAKQRAVSRSSGTMALARPGRFRWQTTAPMKQLMIADGKKMWVYDVELDQVTVRRQDKSLSGTAALFLSGGNTVARDFNVTMTREGKHERYNLQAKSNKANFQRMRLIFVNNLLSALELYDQLGQHTQVKLSHVENNPSLSPSLFQFTKPKGVDLVEQ